MKWDQVNEDYKVRLYKDNRYEVYHESDMDEFVDPIDVTDFQGSISDCESWIRLKESGRL